MLHSRHVQRPNLAEPECLQVESLKAQLDTAQAELQESSLDTAELRGQLQQLPALQAELRAAQEQAAQLQSDQQDASEVSCRAAVLDADVAMCSPGLRAGCAMQLAALQMDLDEACTDAAAERGLHEARLRDSQAQLAQQQALLAARDEQVAALTAQLAAKDAQQQLAGLATGKRGTFDQEAEASPRISALGRPSRVRCVASHS